MEEFEGFTPDMDAGEGSEFDETPESIENLDEAPVEFGPPETPSQYELALPADFPQEYVDPDLMNGFRSWAHEAGLSQQQAKLLFDKYVTFNKASLGQVGFSDAQVKAASEAELKQEWGVNYQANLALANQVIRDCGDDQIRASIAKGDPIWNNPAFARLLHRVGLALKHKAPTGGGGGYEPRSSAGRGGSGTIMDNVDARLAEIALDPALIDDRHPGHRAIVAERDQLMRLKYD